MKSKGKLALIGYIKKCPHPTNLKERYTKVWLRFSLPFFLFPFLIFAFFPFIFLFEYQCSFHLQYATNTTLSSPRFKDLDSSNDVKFNHLR
jgi:hypothetical protein